MLASKSMISFIVLIFSAYCCALPVQDELLTSTSRTFDMDWTTAEMIIKKEQRSEMPLTSEETSTGLSETRTERSELQHIDNELTTGSSLSSDLSQILLPSSSNDEKNSATPSTDSEHPESEHHEFHSWTTMESSTEFAERALSMKKTSSSKMTEAVHPEDLHNNEDDLQEKTEKMSSSSTRSMPLKSKTGEHDQATSVDSFAKLTGLLTEKSTTTTTTLKNKPMKFKVDQYSKPSMKTIVDDKHAESDETSDERDEHRAGVTVTKVSLIPAEETEDETDAHKPHKSMMTHEHMDVKPEQLSQGKKQPFTQTKKPHH